jgi:hypothetical protein
MNAHVMQQINLYQPVVVRGNRLLKAGTVSIAMAAITVVLLASYGYGLHAVSKLSRHVEAAREQQQKQTALLALNAANASPRQLPELQAQLKKLNATLRDHRRALQLLRVGAAGGDSGFSERLVALATQHVDGMWLNHIVLGSDNGVDSLGGGTINAELIPRYINNLAAEPALRGTRINQFEIERKDTGTDADHPGATAIEFHATRIVAAAAEQDHASADTTEPPATSNEPTDTPPAAGESTSSTAPDGQS